MRILVVEAISVVVVAEDDAGGHQVGGSPKCRRCGLVGDVKIESGQPVSHGWGGGQAIKDDGDVEHGAWRDGYAVLYVAGSDRAHREAVDVRAVVANRIHINRDLR